MLYMFIPGNVFIFYYSNRFKGGLRPSNNFYLKWSFLIIKQKMTLAKNSKSLYESRNSLFFFLLIRVYDVTYSEIHEISRAPFYEKRDI